MTREQKLEAALKRIKERGTVLDDRGEVLISEAARIASGALNG